MTLVVTPPSVKVFVAPEGNAFMADIAAWLVDAARCAVHVGVL